VERNCSKKDANDIQDFADGLVTPVATNEADSAALAPLPLHSAHGLQEMRSG